MKRTLLLCFLLLPVVAAAQIYQYQDEQGNISFTDKPTPGAVKVQLKEPQSSPTLPEAPSNATATIRPNPILNKPRYYTSVAITSPLNDDTVRNNIGLIDVSVQVLPELRSGDKIVLVLDGKNVDESLTVRSFTLNNLDRGEHVIQIKIQEAVDGKEVMASTPVTVHLQRPHIDFNKKKKGS